MIKAGRIRLVTFDLDGTMLDDEWAHSEANKRIAGRMGLDSSLISTPSGCSVREMWAEMFRLSKISGDVEEVTGEHFKTTLDIIRESGIHEMTGLSETLKTLKSRSITVAVVSSSDESFVRDVLHILNVGKYIDFSITKKQVKALKPNPEPYICALQKAGISSGQALGVEDSIPGCEALLQAQMYCVGFLNEGQNPQKLTMTDRNIFKMSELTTVIDELDNR